MARDYSSRRNGASSSNKNGSRRNTRAKPAAKPTKPRRSAKGGPPGWVWMISGLCIGLMIAAGVYVFARPGGTIERQQVRIPMPEKREAATSENQAPEPAPSAPAEEEEPRFSFYKMLQNYEVVIPEEEYPDRGSKTSSSGQHSTPAGEPPPKPQTSKPEPTTPKVEEPGTYIIQAGSFSTYEDADRRKAELGLLSLAARIVKVNLDSGKTVYRVQSNPIQSSRELNNMLKRLRDNRIDTMVMRAKN